MRLFADNTDITDGIDSTIWDSIVKSVENDSIDTFKVLTKFVIDVLILSIKNRSIVHYNKYIDFLSSYYYITYKKNKESIVFNKLNEYSTQTSARQLKEIISYFLGYKEDDIEKVNKKNLQSSNDFLYSSFKSFSRMLYLMLSNGDISMFDYVINEYDQIDTLKKFNYYNLKFEVRNKPSEIKNEDLEKKIILYSYLKKYDEYKRHVILGLRYWTIFLYTIQKNDIDTTLKFLGGFNIQVDYSEILKDIMTLRHSPNYQYFEWNSWDYKERLSGKVYTPPNPNDWLTFGFVIDMLQSKDVYFYTNDLDNQQMNDLPFLYDKIDENLKLINDKFDYWKQIIKIENKDEFDLRRKKIIDLFKNLKYKSVTGKERLIADEEIDLEKVEEFKLSIGKSWRENSTINELFFIRKNVIVDNKVSFFIGDKNFFPQTKKMFVRKHYEKIYNTDIIGGQSARWIDDEFFNFVIDKNSEGVVNNSIKKTLDDCIDCLSEKEIKPNLIIVPAIYTYQDEGFLADNDFKGKYEFIDKQKNKYFFGTYKDIDIYISHSEFIANKVVVSKFEDSFRLHYKSQSEWFDSRLKIEVKEINDIEAGKIFELDPKRWMIRNREVNLTKEEAIVLIKNAVNLDIGCFYEFEILDVQSYIVGVIQNDSAK